MTDEDGKRDSRTSATKFVDELSKECIMWLLFFFFSLSLNGNGGWNVILNEVVRFNRILIEF